MNQDLVVFSIRTLPICMKAGKTEQSKSPLRKSFPKTKYLMIIIEAKATGTMNAHQFHSQEAVLKRRNQAQQRSMGSTASLMVSVDLVDKKDCVHAFFYTHLKILKGNTTIYRDVEQWVNSL
ncbi:hypothetical protein SAMN05444008_101174 [Cnuella takakiae]|uniref:Uncharacterized protein n=1 Tax=Cnuella takakiae TaxID=1302690 RepID=A0A1M4SM96_9BACT|nr:hypothetical protein [Cnuella takakiae]OLY94546.1 hypothetical protein BUE76_23750 [Cnuella takakiae]SHE33394.1 hypothetical protein SAMN05444008_101174 [Cnuella takakiae]